LAELDRLAATRRPWTGVPAPILEVVSRQELPRLEARLFGAMSVCRDGEVVQELARRDRARELFALLLLHPDGLPAREIAELLWSDLAPHRAQHNLRMTAYMLRGFLGGKASVRHARLVYRLAPRLDIWTDTQAFDAAVLRSRQASGPAAQQALEEALAVYRGPLLADSGWDWVAPARAMYRSRATAAALRLSGMLAGEDPPRSDALAEWALAVDPISEPAYEQLLRNAQARRDTPAAREVTRRYREMTRRHGLTPNPLLLKAI
jgi:DNA-binding SARP family transcriptional activator